MLDVIRGRSYEEALLLMEYMPYRCGAGTPYWINAKGRINAGGSRRPWQQHGQQHSIESITAKRDAGDMLPIKQLHHQD